ncbi:hypothetical protein AA101099_1969 [Neoasaia chiangmaiensis NBRC 101099]|uniref:Uncharacterized protein n=1 Tax=Neoasaia chiangmaiensis TaxID=320497 RepID=A0A1U9KTH3_9PROT|nr:MmcB family DNA repair protein [Neoasaia chiangmaiensis]AQS89017.1 hypothetical protein A0U93_15060 [Neoasaia chiangmaiensis]GBR40126.1 hypothetical protein AA101099_1969 [Neoasaia chiangmaiensis NBRC 101099]GEN14045.1 hypothetical protein NCH01_04760 [Neoasaia chiangmaiensis]
MSSFLPENQLAIRRAALGLCQALAWAPVNEFALPAAGRRADIMALRPDHGFVCIEVKSGPRDFLTDRKWHEYRDWCDKLYFAVDDVFPLDLLPDDVGIIVVAVRHAPFGVLPECAIIRESPEQKLAPARRRALSHLFGHTAAMRLTMLEDPAITASLRAARRVD